MAPLERGIQGNSAPSCALSERKPVHEALDEFEPLRNFFPAMVEKGPAAPTKAFAAISTYKALSLTVSAVFLQLLMSRNADRRADLTG